MGYELPNEDRYDEALELVRVNQQVSVSFLQRKLRIGYHWAYALIEKMEQAGHISEYKGTKPREVFIK